MSDKKCKERIGAHLTGRLADIRKLWKAYRDEKPEGDELFDYGLCFDYVAPGTFRGQRRGYWRWQLSYGGPSDEFRFYASPGSRGWTLDRVEYWFLDWFDGARRVLRRDRLELLTELWGWFNEAGSVEAVMKKAVEA